MNLAPGTVLQNGKYRINDVLGIGGFGITYRATHVHLSHTVVLKTLNENLRHHPDFVRFQQQFVDEAQRLAQCSHAHIVRVMDFFEEEGLSFIVMDYIPGQTLAQLVETHGPLPEAEALHYIRQIASALETLHQSGLIHRDIKPENIIRRAGTHSVMLIDFGIAREFTRGMQQTHTSLLSPGYAPIEQYQVHQSLTPATDIYALSGTFYYLLTGEPPVAAPLRDRIPLTDLRDFQRNLSWGVELAILRGLNPEAPHRPPTLEEWLTLLDSEQQVVRDKEVEEFLPMPLLPSPSFMMLLFALTAGLAGWMGFDLARRYANNLAALAQHLPEMPSLPSLQKAHPEFRSHDPSQPLFGDPSVQSSPVSPSDTHSPPPESPALKVASPSPTPETSSEVSPAPTPQVDLPSPAPETLSSYPSEPSPEPVAPYNPPPPQAQVKTEPPAVTEVPLSPTPVPEVVPLPPDPPAPESSPTAPQPPNKTREGEGPEPLIPEVSNPTEVPPLPEPVPIVPHPEDSHAESLPPFPSGSQMDAGIPFPEPATN